MLDGLAMKSVMNGNAAVMEVVWANVAERGLDRWAPVAPKKYKLNLQKRMPCRIGLLSWDGATILITKQVMLSLQFNNTTQLYQSRLHHNTLSLKYHSLIPSKLKKAMSQPRFLILNIEGSTNHSCLESCSWSKSKIFTLYNLLNYLPYKIIFQRQEFQFGIQGNNLFYKHVIGKCHTTRKLISFTLS